uniref:Uncharacterized protein n=1 Tax=Arundo donax TaxID=35708 RepID=A0A0A9EQT7_ARUDO
MECSSIKFPVFQITNCKSSTGIHKKRCTLENVSQIRNFALCAAGISPAGSTDHRQHRKLLTSPMVSSVQVQVLK